LIGLDYPNMEQAPDQWGDSVLQPVADAIFASGLVSSSIASMISEAKLDVIKIPGLMEMLSTDAGTAKVFKRFSEANVAKSTINATLLDKEEEWERITLRLNGVDRVLGMYLMICAGAADIPSTRFLSREPAGQNATGESDIRNYYDRISSDQEVRQTPALSRLDEVLIRHALGDRPDEIHYTWNPLWQMSETEKAEIGLKKAQAHKIDVDNMLLNPDALRVGRENQLIEDGFYSRRFHRCRPDEPQPRLTPTLPLLLASLLIAQTGLGNGAFNVSPACRVLCFRSRFIAPPFCRGASPPTAH
jgi:uncharacterized protein